MPYIAITLGVHIAHLRAGALRFTSTKRELFQVNANSESSWQETFNYGGLCTASYSFEVESC